MENSNIGVECNPKIRTQVWLKPSDFYIMNQTSDQTNLDIE